MACEDQRSAAFLNHEKLVALSLEHEEVVQINREQGSKMKEQHEEIQRLQRLVQLNEMEHEDHICNIFYKQQRIEQLTESIEDRDQQIRGLNLANQELTTKVASQARQIEQQADTIARQKNDLEKLEDEKLDLEAEKAKQKEEMDRERQELLVRLADLQKALNRSMEDRETQTELNLENFDAGVEPLHKVEDKVSG